MERQATWGGGTWKKKRKKRHQHSWSMLVDRLQFTQPVARSRRNGWSGRALFSSSLVMISTRVWLLSLFFFKGITYILRLNRRGLRPNQDPNEGMRVLNERRSLPFCPGCCRRDRDSRLSSTQAEATGMRVGCRTL